MKRSLAHLPKQKKDELKHVVSTIRRWVPTTHMIILFGSHARGDWVEHVYREGHTIYEYKSDFDILVVTKDKETIKDDLLWKKVEEQVETDPDGTPVTIIKHHIEDLNQKIRDRYYFFSDIKKEGIFLYNSRRFKLPRARTFSPEERKQVAKEDFKKWFKTAREFFGSSQTELQKRHNNLSAFLLHQATEHAYTAILLAFTGYKPKLHDLHRLGKRVRCLDSELGKVFPRKTKEEERLFILLKKAYVDARYKKTYKITKKELEYLTARVKKLHTMTRRICKAKIESFTKRV